MTKPVDVEKICWTIKHVCQQDKGHRPDEREPCCSNCQKCIDSIRALAAERDEFKKSYEANLIHICDTEKLQAELAEATDELNELVSLWQGIGLMIGSCRECSPPEVMCGYCWNRIKGDYERVRDMFVKREATTHAD